MLFLKKVKRRYDTTSKLWRELPTDAELAERPIELLGSEEVYALTSFFQVVLRFILCSCKAEGHFPV